MFWSKASEYFTSHFAASSLAAATLGRAATRAFRNSKTCSLEIPSVSRRNLKSPWRMHKTLTETPFTYMPVSLCLGEPAQLWRWLGRSLAALAGLPVI